MDMESHGFDEWDFAGNGFDFMDTTGAWHDMKADVLFAVNIDPRYEGLNRAQRRKAMAVENIDPRYAGLNRAQRRKAMAVENRAFRKWNKKRG